MTAWLFFVFLGNDPAALNIPAVKRAIAPGYEPTVVVLPIADAR